MRYPFSSTFSSSTSTFSSRVSTLGVIFSISSFMSEISVSKEDSTPSSFSFTSLKPSSIFFSRAFFNFSRASFASKSYRSILVSILYTFSSRSSRPFSICLLISFCIARNSKASLRKYTFPNLIFWPLLLPVPKSFLLSSLYSLLSVMARF